ncbi:MAG: hypothetical protein GY903_05440 [Fuerstiella sp.]|nr:hypothetical protein [Fuerstiella sp.]MCP4853917.1 hypothetical protein [Fuerstiella sp.]
MKTRVEQIRMALCLGAVLAFFSETTAIRAQRPNIIFIFADDWGYGDMSKHGSTFCKTPNPDRMAEEVAFRRQHPGPLNRALAGRCAGGKNR